MNGVNLSTLPLAWTWYTAVRICFIPSPSRKKQSKRHVPSGNSGPLNSETFAWRRQHFRGTFGAGQKSFGNSKTGLGLGLGMTWGGSFVATCLLLQGRFFTTPGGEAIHTWPPTNPFWCWILWWGHMRGPGGHFCAGWTGIHVSRFHSWLLLIRSFL